ncbi:MAG: substrate-binding domain-containing protein [Lentisphaeria bacterium]|nr:substrate-binding domain-containing protein [Lentisphaeria bacterium]
METGINYDRVAPNRKSPEPLHIQLYRSMVQEIRSLPPNFHTTLMSERELALQLKLSRKTTHRAYEQLIDDRLVRRMPDKSLAVRADARSRIAGAYRVIGVFVTMNFTDFVENNNRSVLPYVEGLIGRSSQLNTSCIMLRTPGRDADAAEIEAFAAEHFPRLCGVIHLGGLNESGGNCDPVLGQLLKHTEIPQVCISGSVPFEYTGSVYADPVPGLDELCRTLHERGFRRAGIIGRDFTTRVFEYIAIHRNEDMRDALKRNGLDCRFSHSYSSAADLNADIHRILTAPDRPEVLLCHDDRVARQLIAQARELGISIPGDLYVSGYDCRSDDPFLASVETYPRALAEAAVDMVMDHFENGVTAENRVRLLPTRFHDGESIKRKSI